MNIYQNINNHKLILAQQWNGSKKLFNELTGTLGNCIAFPVKNHKNVVKTIPDWDSFNVTDRNGFGDYHKNMNLYLLDYPADDSINMSNIEQVVHIGDYLIRNSVNAKNCFSRVKKNYFEKNYKKYKLAQPTLKRMYYIIRLCNIYSDTTDTFVLATGSYKQGKLLEKFLNNIYSLDKSIDTFVLCKFPSHSNINFKTVRWC